jgi:nitrite reductase/ring-hydroxylating ferredoxin subunit
MDDSAWLKISSYTELQSHSRFRLTLRSQEGNYHSLILFRLSSAQDSGQHDHHRESPKISSGALDASDARQIYAMESSCPHLGADMSHAEIEECDDTVVAVCPWHR